MSLSMKIACTNTATQRTSSKLLKGLPLYLRCDGGRGEGGTKLTLALVASVASVALVALTAAAVVA